MFKRIPVFKKISPIDLIATAICIIVIVVFYVVFNRDVVPLTVRFKITDDNPLYANALPGDEYANSFIVGDSEKDELGRVTAKIVNVYSFRITPDRTTVYVDINMKAVYNPRKKQYSAQGKTISFGETFIFSFSKVKFRALAVDFPHFDDEQSVKQTKIIVRAQLRDISRYSSDTYGVPPYIASAIKKDDVVTNSNGEVMLKILDVSIKPALRTIINNAGAFQVLDPELKDVFYTIELSAKQVGGQAYMVGYQRILVGSLVPMNFPTISVFPTIIEIL